MLAWAGGSVARSGTSAVAVDGERARAWQDICQPGTRIARITVERVNVFDPSAPGEDNFFFRTVNTIHRPMLTRERTIRRLLTIREGQPCTPERLEEAERELRGWGFVQDAWVDAVGLEEDGAVIRVRVQDAWTTSVRASASSEGGTTRTVFKIKEENLLGLGASLSWAREEDQDRTQRTFLLDAPSVIGQQNRVVLELANNSDGYRRRVVFERPFWSLATRHAFLAEYDDNTRVEKVYVGPDPIDSWAVDDLGIRADFGLSTNVGPGRYRRLYAGLLQDRQTWSLSDPDGVADRPDLRPYDRDLVQVALRASWERIDFRRVRFVNRAVRIEDLDLGSGLDAELLLPAPGLSEDEGYGLALRVRHGHEPRQGVFLQYAAGLESEWLEGNWINQLAQLEGRIYDRLTRFTTFYARGLALLGNDLEGPRRLLLGGDNGLRGYRSRAFSGERLLLFTLEHRYFAPYEVLHLFRLGLVSFVEAGGAWDGSLGWDDLHPDVGLGLRFAITRSSGGATVHVNAAVPLDPNGDIDEKTVRFSVLTLATF